jgi:serine acetyltransferase
MGDIKLSKMERMLRSRVQKYSHEKYWRFRQFVVDSTRGSRLGKLRRLYYIKRADAFNNASMGTHRNFGAVFGSAPNLPHGLNGIIVSHNAVIGENCTIFHQVTIGEGRGGAPVIGNNVLIGAGAKVIGGIRIGDNVKIGAGCVVSKDVPDDATVVMDHVRIITSKRD